MSSKKSGKPVALVTGAGVRLGRAVAEGLASRGCDLILHAHGSRKEAKALGRALERHGVRVKLLFADLSRAASCKRLARDAWRSFQRVDILVNNAAIYWPTPPARLSSRELDTFLDLNLKAPYILATELGRRMKKRGTGVIVNMACLSAFRAWGHYVPYSISKAGVVALTQGLAKLLAPEVRVNAIAPGTVLPPKKYTKAKREKLRRGIPLGRLGSPKDIVRAVEYLIDSDFTTGVVLPVDGGRLLK